MQVNEVKRRIDSDIHKNENELIKLCSDILKIETENPPCDMTEISGYLKDYLGEFGCKYQIFEPEKGRISIVSETGRGSHPHLIFNGHMDVVPAGDISRWSFSPYGGEVRGGYILGRGSADMKCGLGGMAFVLCMIHRLDLDMNGKLTLMAVPDEETGAGFGTQYLLQQGIIKGNGCIVGEPTGSSLVEIGQKGRITGIVKVKGEPIHSSLSPICGDSAITKMSKLLPFILKIHDVEFKPPEEITDIIEDNKSIYRELAGEGTEKMLSHVSINFGVIRGGTATNIVPESCECTLDMRLPLGSDHKEIRKMLARAPKETGVEGVTFEIESRNAFYFSPNEPIVKITGNNVKELLGLKPHFFVQWACSDVAYFHRAGIPTIQYGPSGSGIHGYNEKVRIIDVINATRVFAASAVEFLADDRRRLVRSSPLGN